MFKEFRDLVNDQFKKMILDAKVTGTKLFKVDVDPDEFYQLYLNSFPEGTNEIYRVRREYDCSCCRNFIKNIGTVIAITEFGERMSVWDIKTDIKKYQVVADALTNFIESTPIKDVWLTKECQYGAACTYEALNGKSIQWDHFYGVVPNIARSNDVGTDLNKLRTGYQVFKRTMEEISIDSVNMIIELCESNTLYKGNEWLSKLKKLRHLLKYYPDVLDEKKDDFCWYFSIKHSDVAMIRNTSIGTLLVNLSEGMDLEEAVSRYEKITAPTNYKRSKAIYTKKMLDDAKKKIEELGLTDSLGRRFAKLDDITVNNVLFANRDTTKRLSGDIFDELFKDIKTKPQEFKRVEEVSVRDFINNILPTANNIELYMENRYTSNMVSLIAPAILDAKTMFKWNNNMSWTYNGNLTDSMKETVKKYGGDVDGDLRFSIMWSGDGEDNNDLDAHCRTPYIHIYYGNKCDRINNGTLDVDITHPLEDERAKNNNGVAVENIIFKDKDNMMDGAYDMFIDVYGYRGGHSGFEAEIEFDGEIYHYSYDDVRGEKNIKVATVTLKDGKFSIQHHLKESETFKNIWGVNTNNFVPVNLICYSPNYWDEQHGIGNQHLFFMLEGCINPDNPSGFFNEYLKNDLREHRKVFEALSSKMRVENSDDQLSGIGFCMTKRENVVLKVKSNNIERVVKVIF